MSKADVLYLSTIGDCERETAISRFEQWRATLTKSLHEDEIPIFTREDIPYISAQLRSRYDVISGTGMLSRQ